MKDDSSKAVNPDRMKNTLGGDMDVQERILKNVAFIKGAILGGAIATLLSDGVALALLPGMPGQGVAELYTIWGPLFYVPLLGALGAIIGGFVSQSRWNNPKEV